MYKNDNILTIYRLERVRLLGFTLFIKQRENTEKVLLKSSKVTKRTQVQTHKAEFMFSCYLIHYILWKRYYFYQNIM